MLPNKVSIIIVTYNAGKTLRDAIKSIVDQQYAQTELIIVDGGSSDETLSIILEFENFIARWISEKDNGIYDAMNKGLRLATGKWVIFLGADDKLCRGILPEIFEGKDYGISEMLYGRIDINGSGRLRGEESDYQKMIRYNIPHQGIFYTRELLQKFNGYDLRYKILADYDLNLKIFNNPNIAKQFIDKPVAEFCSQGISNRTIDYDFFSEKLHHFVMQEGLSKFDKRLAKYYFFTGVAMILKKEYRRGMLNVLHPILFGGDRFYHFLLTGNFVLSLVGITKKFKYV